MGKTSKSSKKDESSGSSSEKQVKTEKHEKPEKQEKTEKVEKSAKSEKPEKSEKVSNTKKSSVFKISSVWPSEIIKAHKIHGDSMCRIDLKKQQSYGDGSRQIKVFPKLINVSLKKDEEEWHPVLIELLNTPTAGWIGGVFEKKDEPEKKSKSKSKSKKSKDDEDEDGDEDGGMKPKIPFARSTKFIRQEDGKDVEEPLGEAVWLLSEIFQKMVNNFFEGDRDVFKKTFGDRKKIQFSPFQLYRKYNDETDNKDDMVVIDGREKIKTEDPTFNVNVRCDKAGNVAVIFKDVTDKSKIRKKGNDIIFPTATVGGNPLTVKTIGKFITPGSLCSGVIKFDQLKVHSFGFSQPFDISWRKLSDSDDKAVQSLYIKRIAQEGGKPKMDSTSMTMAMLGTVDIEEGDDSEEEKKKAKKKAQQEMVKKANKKTSKSESKSESESGSGSGSGSESGSGSANDDSDASEDSGEESSEKKPKKDAKKDSKKDSKEKETKKDAKEKDSKKNSKEKDSKEKDTKNKKDSKKSKKDESSTESADGSSADLSDLDEGDE